MYVATANGPNLVTHWGQNSYIFAMPDPDLRIHYKTFYWAAATIKGRLLSSRAMLKPFSDEIILSRRNWAQNDAFGEIDIGFCHGHVQL